MSSTTNLLTELRNTVWGNQTILENQHEFSDPGTGHSHTVTYLDFGNYLNAIKVIAPTIRSTRFLVREEYRHALQTFEKDDTYNGGACIMGQPGIGKSCFIAYAVIEWLRKKQPVAVQILPENCDESYALFSEDGVSLHPAHAHEPLRKHPGIWTFSDSNADVNIPAIAFRTTPNVKVFQTTSPKVSRWKEWTKQNMITRYIMDVWSTEEISALAVLLELDVNRMNDLASKWGPVPRTLLQTFEVDQELSFGPSMRSTASGAIHDCRNILRSMASLEALPPAVDAGPSPIFFIRPRKTRDAVSRVLHTIYIPTQAIAEILGAAVCSAAEGDRQIFFNSMITYPGTRAAAGFIFQIWIHSFLASGNPIDCKWHGKASKSLPSTLCLAKETVCTNNELQLTSPPFYWRAPPDFEGIDGALFDAQEIVYAIQTTISSKHGSPQPGMIKLRHLLKDESAKKKKWRVLFIGNKLEQSEAVSKKFIDEVYMDTDGDGSKRKKSKPVPVGWCATSPLNAEITVVNTLTNYVPLESDDA
ncbi:hypothetical protein OG21DRAFT_1486476 [Imleria badia]|nr:hypothetical protein OG21DRAFT_1486476 [Imleria badia]